MTTHARRLILSLVALTLATTASAAPVRDLDGNVVDLEAADVTVFFSMLDADAPALLRNAQARSSEDLLVVAINIDPPAARARLKPYLRHRQLDLVVVSDPERRIPAP